MVMTRARAGSWPAEDADDEDRLGAYAWALEVARAGL
jgi:hypothetical protein